LAEEKTMATASLAKAEDRLAKEQASKLMAKLDIEVRTGRLTVQQSLTLGMVYTYGQANPDGRFNEVLVAMLQGEF
jgi:hypothetical protein